MMKNKFLVAGILGVLLVFGMALTGCSNGTTEGGDPVLNGTWGNSSEQLTISGTEIVVQTNGVNDVKGTLVTSGNTVTVTMTHYWQNGSWVAMSPPVTDSGTYSVSGGVLTITYSDGSSDTYTSVGSGNNGSGNNGGGNNGGGPGGGVDLTISGISGTWSVIAIKGNPATLSAASSAIAAASSGGTNGGTGGIINSTNVVWVAEPAAGSYTIIISSTDGVTYKKAAGVSIPGSVSYSSFTALPMY